MRGVGNDTRNGVLSIGIGDRLTREDKRCCTIGYRRAGCRGNRAVLGKGSFQSRDFVRHALAGLFVGIDNDIALSGGNGYGNNFLLECAIGNSFLCAAQRFNRISILRLARELIIIGGVLRECTHSAASLVGVF